jgi:AbrB family transcriptional regulator, stage V sporulation protein T
VCLNPKKGLQKNYAEGDEMKPTGIVRRVDDLGRVVMPKELRRTLRIRDGDPLEVYVSNDSVMLRKYAPAGAGIGDFAQDYAKTLSEVTGHIALVADQESFVAVAGIPQREYLDKPIPDSWLKETKKAPTGFFKDTDEDTGTSRNVAYCNIVDADGAPQGLVAIVPKDATGSVGDLELKLTSTAASFIAKRMT